MAERDQLRPRRDQPPANPSRAMEKHSGYIDGEFREIHPVAPVSATPQRASTAPDAVANAPEPGTRMKYPSGLATLAAYFRAGLKDVQDRIVDPWHGSARQHAELGTLGHVTQLEPYQERTQEPPAPELDGGVHGKAEPASPQVQQPSAADGIRARWAERSEAKMRDKSKGPEISM